MRLKIKRQNARQTVTCKENKEMYEFLVNARPMNIKREKRPGSSKGTPCWYRVAIPVHP